MTDHRINLTLYKIDRIMDGELDDLVNALAAEQQAEQLAQLAEERTLDGPGSPTRCVGRSARSPPAAGRRGGFLGGERGGLPGARASGPDAGTLPGLRSQKKSRRAGGLHPRPQGVLRTRARGQPGGPHPAAGDRAAGRSFAAERVCFAWSIWARGRGRSRWRSSATGRRRVVAVEASAAALSVAGATRQALISTSISARTLARAAGGRAL